MTWHVIRVRSKDAQKQLARTSLREYNTFLFLRVLYQVKEPDQAKEHQAGNNQILRKLTLSNPSLTLQFGIHQAA